jgi:hypothetical protein
LRRGRFEPTEWFTLPAVLERKAIILEGKAIAEKLRTGRYPHGAE